MIQRRPPLQLLRPPQGKCLGAAFCTYRFDERFFDSVLAALLPIHADPESDSRMFLAEARRRLRETPVVVLADGNGYPGGHRLPYDIILSPLDVALHARMAFLLFRDHARLIIGSANLTPGGFGEAADLCATLCLKYDRDGALANEVVRNLAEAGAGGEGWQRFVHQCNAMFPSKARSPTRRRANESILSTRADAPVLVQFLDCIPKAAKITAVHLLSPAQPEDDACEPGSVFEPLSTFMAERGKGAPLNVALAWPNPSVSPATEPTLTRPEELAGYLCAETVGPPGAEEVIWTPVSSVDGQRMYFDSDRRPLLLKAALSVMQRSPPGLWAVEEVVGVGLLDAILPITDEQDTSWWLYPEIQQVRGKMRRRPFHAKMVAVCTVEKGKPMTHVLLNAPNFPRGPATATRMHEIAFRLRFPGHTKIDDLCPDLIPAPANGFYLEDRSWLPTERRHAAPIESAIYDAKSNVLWLEAGPRAPECRITYQRDSGEEELLVGKPSLRTSIPNFLLGPAPAEVRVAWEDRQAFVPVTVRNISFLRADEPVDEIGFGELIAYYGRQRGLRTSGNTAYGRDVFQVQEIVVDTLCNTGAIWGAFEVALNGPVGLRAFAAAMLAAEHCDPGEAWIYGLELCRSLDAIDWHQLPLGAEKKRAVQGLLKEVRSRLRTLAPKAPWTSDVIAFYGGKK